MAPPSVDYAVQNGLCTSVPAYVAATFPANDPCEDRHFFVHDEDTGATVMGVLDGHGGDACSAFMARRLPRAIQARLTRAGAGDEGKAALLGAVEEVEQAWADFVLSMLDNQPLCSDDEAAASTTGACKPTRSGRQPRQGRGGELFRALPEQSKALAHSGACAVIGLMKNGLLLIANIGDCRGVLGTQAVAPAVGSASRASTQFMNGAARVQSATEAASAGGGEAPLEARVYAAVQRKLASRGGDAQSSKVSAADALGTGVDQSVVRGILLTRDHNHSNLQEVLAVQERQVLVHGSARDSRPFRPSAGDVARRVQQPPVRVAGSLSVTRALGDLYLKHEGWACGGSTHTPYICAVPELTVHEVNEADLFLVLSSDGVHERLSCQEVVDSVLEPRLRHTVAAAATSIPPPPPRRAKLQRANTTSGTLTDHKPLHNLRGPPASLLAMPLRWPGSAVAVPGTPRSTRRRRREVSSADRALERSPRKSQRMAHDASPGTASPAVAPLVLGHTLPPGICFTSGQLRPAHVLQEQAWGAGTASVHSSGSMFSIVEHPVACAAQGVARVRLGTSAADRIAVAALAKAGSLAGVSLPVLLGGSLRCRRRVHDDVTSMVVFMPGALQRILQLTCHDSSRGQRSIVEYARPRSQARAATVQAASHDRVVQRRRGGAAQLLKARQLAAGCANPGGGGDGLTGGGLPSDHCATEGPQPTQ